MKSIDTLKKQLAYHETCIEHITILINMLEEHPIIQAYDDKVKEFSKVAQAAYQEADPNYGFNPTTEVPPDGKEIE